MKRFIATYTLAAFAATTLNIGCASLGDEAPPTNEGPIALTVDYPDGRSEVFRGELDDFALPLAGEIPFELIIDDRVVTRAAEVLDVERAILPDTPRGEMEIRKTEQRSYEVVTVADGVRHASYAAIHGFTELHINLHSGDHRLVLEGVDDPELRRSILARIALDLSIGTDSFGIDAWGDPDRPVAICIVAVLVFVAKVAIVLVIEQLIEEAIRYWSLSNCESAIAAGECNTLLAAHCPEGYEPINPYGVCEEGWDGWAPWYNMVCRADGCQKIEPCPAASTTVACDEDHEDPVCASRPECCEQEDCAMCESDPPGGE